MSRRFLIALIIAIVSVHVFAIWLVLQTNEAENTISEEGEETAEASAPSDGENVLPGDEAQADESAKSLEAGKPAASDAQEKTPSAEKDGKTKKPSVQKTEKQTGKKFVPPDKLSSDAHPHRTFKVDAQGAKTGNLSAVPLTANASAGILAEYDGKNSFKVLWQKNPDKQVPIASLSKIMTLLLVGEMAADGKSGLTYETVIPVTAAAANVPPSSVNLRTGESFTLEDLMIAASVRSANDATFLIAQYAGGGKAETFVAMMNERAKGLSMSKTEFFNPHGLPGRKKNLDNHSSVKEILYLCSEFMRHKDLMKWAATRTGTFRPGSKKAVAMQNHNHLLPGGRNSTPGVTGIKTGYTVRAGYCVAVSCVRNGRTLILVVTGFKNMKERDKCASAVIEWGFKNR